MTRKPTILPHDLEESGPDELMGNTLPMTDIKVPTEGTQPDLDATKPSSRRKLDPELKAMDEICATLEDLDQAAQQRVVSWAISRFLKIEFPRV